MDNHTLTIHPEIAKRLRGLTDDEKSLLEENIVQYGEVREPIVVWGDHIIDGIHRYEIAQKHGIEFNVHGLSFPGIKECLEWVLRNQLGRRNLTTYEAKFYRGALYNSMKGEPGGKGGSKDQTPVGGANSQLDHSVQEGGVVNTAQEVADVTGVSPSTVVRDGAFVKDYDRLTEAWRTVLEGRGITPNHAQVKKILSLPKDKTGEILRVVRTGSKSLVEALNGIRESRS